MSEKWYVLPVHGNVEETLKDILQDNDINAFLPKIEKVHKNQGVLHIVTIPMFPECLFVKTELSISFLQNELKKLEKDTALIKQLQYDAIICLKENDIALLKRLMDKDYIVRASSGDIENGCICLDTGPLLGLENHIVKIDRHKRIAYLENVILGKQLKVSLEIVKKI